MGVLSIRLKPNFLGLLKFVNSMNWFIVFFSLINLSLCIYEDQIGKFDWRQSYVGRIKFAQFDTSSTAKRLIVATEENVLAALNLKTGALVWRQVLETASAGNIHMLYLNPSDQAITVTGANPYLVRGWDVATGILAWEWSLTLTDDDRSMFSEWFVSQNRLFHLLPAFGKHLEVTSYNLATGENSGRTSKFPATWSNEGCVFSAPYYICVSGLGINRQLIALDVASNAVQLISEPLTNFVGLSAEGTLEVFDANPVTPGFIIDDTKIVVIKDAEFIGLNVPVSDVGASATVVESGNGPIVLQTWTDSNKVFNLKAHSLTSGEEIPDVASLERLTDVAEPEVAAAMCTRARESLVCRILLTAADDCAHLLQQGGKVLWSREEALANIVAVEFVDLPVSDLDAAIESEFDQKEGSIWGAFTRRIQTQMQQLQNLLILDDSATKDGPEPLVRDYFNLHKLLVLVTDAGKIFGMDNLSGELLWKIYEPNLDTSNVVLMTRRSARHPPHPAYLSIVGKHVETGNGLIISLDPIRGRLVGERVLQLDVQLLQCAMLHTPDAEKLHALLLLDKDENVLVLPTSASHLVQNMFIFVADKNDARVQGYALKYDGKSVVAQKTWSINLGGAPNAGHRIVAFARKSPSERAHSAGRVLGDRSVLYKYSNPNLLLFVTQGPDPLHKDIVVSTVVDGASGAVVTSASHRRARAAPLAAHADNFMAYLYYNDKYRRTEIATLELYEGAARWSEGVFSSLRGARAPHVQRQAYILPAAPAALATTLTERSITDIHVLMALTTGAIIEIPWAYLEPRRSVSLTPEEREEGLIPYAPELPLHSEAVLNYNKTLHRVTAIYTAPSGLESNTLVLATGLDLFYTRVAPSKTFDLLKDDFDYSLISIVLVALIVATYSTKYFASRKVLRMAWK